MSDTPATTATTVPASTAPITPAEAVAKTAAIREGANQPQIPAGHKLVSESDYAKYTAASQKLESWGSAVDALEQQGFSPSEIATILTTPAQKPVTATPAPSAAADVEKIIEKRFAARDHTDALAKEADSLNTTVVEVIGKDQPPVLQEMVAALAKQHADSLRTAYPHNHPLAGQRAPLTREQVAAVKTFAAEKFKSLSGSLAKQVGARPTPGVAGNFAPSGPAAQPNQNGVRPSTPQNWTAQEKAQMGEFYLEQARAKQRA